MKPRLLAFALLACAPAAAQLQLSGTRGGVAQAVSGAFDLGAIETGDALETVFRLHNPGAAGVKLERLSVAGTGFSMRGAPQLPVTLLPGAMVDFVVRFQPVQPVPHAAVLTFNAQAVFLLAAARPGPLLRLEQSAAALAPGDVVDFPETAVGSASQRRFVVSNPTAFDVDVGELFVSGAGFQGPVGLAAPALLSPGQAAGFEVSFAPQTGGAAEGLLQLNGRAIRLRGAAVEPPLPRPLIEFDPPQPRSGEQVRLVVRFAAKVRAAAKGQVAMEFRGPADPAIQFLSPAGRSAVLDVAAGQDAALPDLWFQTGSTAGMLVFTVRFGTYTEQTTLVLSPLPVALDAASATRSASAIEVRVTGFDNARSAAQATFTFLDRDGRVLGGGPLRVDLTEAFRGYFAASDAGGLFALRASFPVKGDASSVASVDVELANALGVGRRNVKMAP